MKNQYEIIDQFTISQTNIFELWLHVCKTYLYANNNTQHLYNRFFYIRKQNLNRIWNVNSQRNKNRYIKCDCMLYIHLMIPLVCLFHTLPNNFFLFFIFKSRQMHCHKIYAILFRYIERLNAHTAYNFTIQQFPILYSNLL